MVGIAAKKCAWCRRRKIRCDMAMPSCGQCKKSKRICGGYDQPTTFLNHFSDNFNEKPIQTSNVPSGHVGPEDGTKSRGNDESVIATIHWRDPSVINFISCSRLDRHQLLANFVDATLPRQRSRQVPLSWIIDVANNPNEANSLSYAGAAIGHGWIGHFDMLPPAVKRGHQSYLESLAFLRKDLIKPNTLSYQAQITTMALLLLYEMIEFGVSDASGWIAHADGIEATLARITPQAFVAATNHKMFLFCRAVLIVKSLTMRRKTILGTDEWIHGPWMLYPKSFFHKLLDLGAEFAGLVEDFDLLSSQKQRSSSAVRKWAASIALLVLRLKKWEKTHGCILPEMPPKAVKGPLPVPATSQSTARDLARHWYPSTYPDRTGAQFLLLQQVRLMLFYWALVVSLQACVLDAVNFAPLQPSVGEGHSEHNGIGEFEEDIRAAITTSDATQCADLITLWFRFAVQDAWQSFGPAFGVFSLKAATNWYEVYQRRRLPDLEPDRTAELESCRSLLGDFINYGSPRTKGY